MKQFDLFSKDIILIPINHSNSHWTAAAINFRRKRIESYDSMGMDRNNVYKVCSCFHLSQYTEPVKLLRLYLDAEHRNKRKQPFDFTGWEDHTLEVCHFPLSIHVTSWHATTGYTSTRKYVWLRCLHLPFPWCLIQGLGTFQLFSKWHGLFAEANDLGNRARQAS